MQAAIWFIGLASESAASMSETRGIHSTITGNFSSTTDVTGLGMEGAVQRLW
jgi:hypothetical protein